MIMKNGAPYQMLTRITAKRAQKVSDSHGMCGPPRLASNQLTAEWVGSNSHHQPSVESAGGITHGTSIRPRQTRCPRSETLWIRWAQTKPISALKMTAVRANRIDCRTTIQKVLRSNRKKKFPRPMNSVSALFNIER